MNRARWRNRFGLPVLLMTALLSSFLTPAALSAGLRPAAPVSVDCGAITPASAARDALATSGRSAATVRAQPQIAKRGELIGRNLSAQTATGRVVSISLPAESFIGPAVGDLVVYSRYLAGTGSEVRALSLASGCDVRLAKPAEIVRSALVDRSGAFLYVHSVARSGRADAGVVRYDLASGTSVQVLEPIRPGSEFGLIYGTDLRWSVAGDRLAVQSCGFDHCLTRVLEIATGNVATFDASGQGAFLGLTNAHLVTFAECDGLPCAVLSTDLVTGSASVLAAEAFSAQLKASNGRAAVVSIETSAGVVEVVQ